LTLHQRLLLLPKIVLVIVLVLESLLKRERRNRMDDQTLSIATLRGIRSHNFAARLELEHEHDFGNG